MTSPAPYELILASKVNGVPVFNPAQERIGHVDDVAIGKLDGKVAYAILSLGGFLGIGDRYHPIPWSILDYDPAVGGYVIPLTKEQLDAAPHYSREELADTGGSDHRYRDGVYEYYKPFGAKPHWVFL